MGKCICISHRENNRQGLGCLAGSTLLRQTPPPTSKSPLDNPSHIFRQCFYLSGSQNFKYKLGCSLAILSTEAAWDVPLKFLKGPLFEQKQSAIYCINARQVLSNPFTPCNWNVFQMSFPCPENKWQQIFSEMLLPCFYCSYRGNLYLMTFSTSNKS